MAPPPPPGRVATDVSGGHEDTEDIIDYELDEAEEDSPPEVILPEGDDLDRIVALQTFEGWWKLDDCLLRILELSAAEAEKHIPGNVSLEVWATVLAIRFLEGKLADRKDAWELVVEKARGWIDGQGVSDQVLGQLVEVAGGLLDAE